MLKKMLFASAFCCAVSLTHAETVKIYAAASLTNALIDITKLYEKKYPETKIIPVFGASSALAKQIEAGAKSDLYLSADVDWMQYLVQKNAIQMQQVKPLLFNQLVVIRAKNLNIPFKAQSNFNFAKTFKGRLCTGQMESVPVGKYAKQILVKLNWFDALKGRIVGTDDVRSALAFVERGECDVGIVYKTDALISQKVKMLGTFPQNSHHPIIYPLALTVEGQKNKEAVHFKNFVQRDPQAKAIFVKYGFSLNSSLH